MSAAIETSPVANNVTHDPLLVLTPRSFAQTFYPYGFPLVVSSNSQAVIEAAEQSWVTCKQRFDAPELDVRCFVSEEGDACTRPAVFRGQGHLISIVGDRDNFASVDVNAAFSFGWVTARTVANTSHFRYVFLDAMAYILLEIRDLVSVHAACVQYAGRGLLLAGDSGAGKSSLAYACARSGWTFLSDDGSALVRASAELEALGTPERFRFRDTAVQLFPEFDGLTATPRCSKPTIEIETAGLSGIDTARSSPLHALVFLNRQSSPCVAPELINMPSQEVWRRLSASLFAMQHPSDELRTVALARLLDLPAFELRYRDLQPAVDVLQKLALRCSA